MNSPNTRKMSARIISASSIWRHIHAVSRSIRTATNAGEGMTYDDDSLWAPGQVIDDLFVYLLPGVLDLLFGLGHLVLFACRQDSPLSVLRTDVDRRNDPPPQSAAK
jgi:hypothetical protein